MKKMFLYAAIVLLATACKMKEAKTETGATASAAPADMPYTLDKPWKEWAVGDPQNAVTVMKFLKAWEGNKVDESLTYFADSCELIFDNYRAKLGQDSLKSFIKMTL